MPGYPVTPFLLLTFVGFVLVLLVLFATRRGMIGRTVGGVLAAVIVSLFVGSMLAAPSLGIVDNHLSHGVPFSSH